MGYLEWSGKDRFKVIKNECMETIYDSILIVQEREDENPKQNGDSETSKFYSNSVSPRTQGCGLTWRRKQKQECNRVDGIDQRP